MSLYYENPGYVALRARVARMPMPALPANDGGFRKDPPEGQETDQDDIEPKRDGTNG